MKDTVSEGRTSLAVNHILLLVCLFSIAAIGTTYYYLDFRKEAYQIQGFVVLVSWYITIGISTIKVFNKTRTGYLIAGILFWTTFAFWMLDNWYVVFHTSIILPKPDYITTIRNFIGSGIAVLGILSSHNAFNKTKRKSVA